MQVIWIYWKIHDMLSAAIVLCRIINYVTACLWLSHVVSNVMKYILNKDSYLNPIRIFSANQSVCFAALNFHIFNLNFSLEPQPFSTKLGTMHSWLKGFQISQTRGNKRIKFKGPRKLGNRTVFSILKIGWLF